MDILTATPATPRDMLVWQHAAVNLRAGIPVALLCVLQSVGSSPGRQGFKMTVTAGSLAGSIGGGIMEHKFVELARTLLRQPGFAPVLRHQVHRREAPSNRSGMICSGEQWVLLLPLSAADLPVISRVKQQLRGPGRSRLWLTARGGVQVEELAPPGPHCSVQLGSDWAYSEQIGFRDQATIVGAGHVALALSRVLASLEFDLTVLDDRPGLNTHLLNPFAHYKRTVQYEQLPQEIPAGPHQYVILMTFGYRSDLVALRALLQHPVRYLGVMGSQAKIAEMMAVLRAEGVSEQDLARVHAPIGLPINSRTPEEIAISIAAELIRERNTP
ncbi:XdhC family protein [Hymenobacter metallilatus]|uniref:XdhC/CoxI family protein n=1 Tax=Hymenobacter metallilatus TaxID=2493666 RepID=A0A3R9N133_9BACT|nr:XdhC/CoxI family protein [Hymenobacter metallilatus]RSK36006.1 XdhC/CoxI family protein [Hymenobacter metallilatus]